jgi:hypothetical protein
MKNDDDPWQRLFWIWCLHSDDNEEYGLQGLILCILQTSWWYDSEDHTLQWGSCWEIHLVTELVKFYLLLIFCINEVHVLCLIRSERIWGNTIICVFSFCSEDWQFCIWCEDRPRQLAAFTGENKVFCLFVWLFIYLFVCVCVYVHVHVCVAVYNNRKSIELARIKCLFLQFFWEPINVEN